MRFHVVGLPHLPVARRFTACAFTARTYKFCEMMLSRGHEVILYSVEGSDAPCSKRIDVAGATWRKAHFGNYDSSKVGYAEKGFSWDSRSKCWQQFNESAAEAITRQRPNKDFVCFVGGVASKPMVEAIKGVFHPVEYCVGYLGSFAPFQVFESYAQMHHMYGRWSGHVQEGCDGRNFDAVIPGSYHLDDFTFVEKPAKAKPFILYVGRIVERKGIQIAVEATKRAGVQLFVCGQGDPVYKGDHVTYLGHVDAGQRDHLMGYATAIMVPSIYIEPFGGVNVEAQLCGTPVIASDWGAFPETVEHGKTGYRCRTLEQWTWATNNVHALDRRYISDRARRLYSMERIAGMYDEYFHMLYSLWGEGWYAENASRDNLNWLKEAA